MSIMSTSSFGLESKKITQAHKIQFLLLIDSWKWLTIFHGGEIVG